MKILSSAFLSHDSSATIITDGKIEEYILAERKTRKKHEYRMFEIFHRELIHDENKQIKNYDSISCSFFNDLHYERYRDYLYLLKNLKSLNILFSEKDHHLCHAYTGFYSSNFTDAICIVIDGNGSTFRPEEVGRHDDDLYFETQSVYEFKDGKIEKVISKEYTPYSATCFYGSESVDTLNQNFFDLNFEEKIYNPDKKSYILGVDTNYPLGIGMLYSTITEKIGFNFLECGKVMGLAQYKGYENKLPPKYSTDEWKRKVEISHKLQKITETKILKLVEKYANETGIKNIVLTGGVFLNCVSNFNLVKNIQGINLHIDPICSDNGISVGKAILTYIEETKKNPSRIGIPYFGYEENTQSLKLKVKDSNFDFIENVKYADIVEILLKGEIVSLFQGKSESGQRSLGNRSLLFDPRIKNGRTIVNRIKKREDYRPFAASVLLEHAKDWFDMHSLDESPTMSFAVDSYENAVKLVPSVIHADGTCRIQTVTKKQNYHFYNLIKEFYKKTNVPMLLNTSFNLSKEPLVETFDDAINVMKSSELKYLYLPEINTLVKK